jgi:hypothetical protein
VFVQATLVPSIPQIAKDLNSTHANVRCALYEFSGGNICAPMATFRSFGVSLSIFAAAVGALVWAAYSSFCEAPIRRDSSILVLSYDILQMGVD